LFENLSLNKLAKLTKFTSRKSGKLSPIQFIDLLLYGVSTGIKSLEQMCQYAKEEHSIEISKQALDQRFSSSSTCFMKELVSEVLKSQVTESLHPSTLQHFNTVKIKDSTIIELHESLSDCFEGFGKGGGRNSKSGVSVQFEYDLKTHRIYDIDLSSAVKKDSLDARGKTGTIQEKDLIIRDLGYYSDDVIGKIIERKAYFLSKLYHSTGVRRMVGKQIEKDKIDFGSLYQEMVQKGLSELDFQVALGRKARVVRMVVILMPDSVYEQRVRQKNKENKSTRYTTSQEYKERAHFNIYICNIGENVIDTKSISELYRVRWQIELVFKSWKSVLKINEFRKIKKERFVTTMFAKILWMLINWTIFSSYRGEFYQSNKKLLGIVRGFTALKEESNKIRRIFFSSKKEISILFEKILNKLRLIKGYKRRKNRYNIIDLIHLLFV